MSSNSSEDEYYNTAIIEKPTLKRKIDDCEFNSIDNQEPEFVTNSNGDTYLHYAIKKGLKSDIATLALNLPNRLKNLRNRDLDTPLHLTVKYNMEESTSILIKNGADVNLMDRKGRTPFTLCFYYGREKIISHFLNENINIDYNVCDYAGDPPLFLAYKNNHKEFLLKVMQKTNKLNVNNRNGRCGDTLAHLLAESNDTQLMWKLTNMIKINSTNFSGYTPFEVAKGKNLNKMTDLITKILAAHSAAEDDSSE